MSKLIDITKQKFGRLTILSFSHMNEQRKSYWNCQCDCGILCIKEKQSMRSGNTKSCGCLNKEELLNNPHGLKHGCSSSNFRTKEYKTWAGMKHRTTNPIGQNKKWYDGITVCNRWLNSFENFLEDMGKCPKDKKSIDRINPYGNYEPGNCRWATNKEQSNNRKKSKEYIKRMTYSYIDGLGI